MLCAGLTSNTPDDFIVDTCQGDSGGPLATLSGGNWYLTGIVSWGIGCSWLTPGVYTNTAWYLGWISSTAVPDWHAVTYNSNSGSAVAPGSFVTASSILGAPTPPTRSGYTLNGWSETNGGSVITFPYFPGVTTDITLYAKWTQNAVKATSSVKPKITGTAKVAQNLTAANGTWSGFPTPKFAYQWFACTSAVTASSATAPANCKAINGAIKSTFKLTKTQKGKFVAVKVIGKSAGTSATSWLSKSTAKVK